MLRILSIDPSGTGTTGMFLCNLKKDGRKEMSQKREMINYYRKIEMIS